MRVNTNRYEAAHGKKPRGFGMWSFEHNAGYQKIVFATGNYSEAKKEAIKAAQEKGASEIIVLP